LSDEDLAASAELGREVNHPDHPNPLPGYMIDGFGTVVFDASSASATIKRRNDYPRCGY
jgi:hypothetical protein